MINRQLTTDLGLYGVSSDFYFLSDNLLQNLCSWKAAIFLRFIVKILCFLEVPMNYNTFFCYVVEIINLDVWLFGH